MIKSNIKGKVKTKGKYKIHIHRIFQHETTWRDREGTECGILNQLKVTENYYEPSATLSIGEKKNMEQTPNVPPNCEQYRVSLAARS